MFVAPWSPDFNPEKAPLTSAVVPVEFREVPYLLFNKESLARIATAVGKPVSIAPETERKETFEVAKVFIRVDLRGELPKKIITGFSSGKEVEILISYPWLPIRCEICEKYGHDSPACTQTSVPRKVWRRKPSRSRSRHARRGRSNTVVSEKRVEIEGTPSSLSDDEAQPLQQDKNLVQSGDHDTVVSEKDNPSDVVVTTSEEEPCMERNEEVASGLEGRSERFLPEEIPHTSPGSSLKSGVEISQILLEKGPSGIGKQNSEGDAPSQVMIAEGINVALDPGIKEGTEQPFFLVTRRKSGRKANKH